MVAPGVQELPGYFVVRHLGDLAEPSQLALVDHILERPDVQEFGSDLLVLDVLLFDLHHVYA